MADQHADPRPARPHHRQRRRHARRLDARRRPRRRGREQAAGAGRPAGRVPLAAVVTSPLERCRETADALLAAARRAARARRRPPRRVPLRRLDRPPASRELAKDPLWKVVQAHPSAVDVPRRRGRVDARHAGRARSTPYGTGTPGSAAGGADLGGGAATATSSRPRSPTRSACTSTSSSGSRSTRARSPWSATPRCARSWSGSTTPAAASTRWCRRPPGRGRRAGARPDAPAATRSWAGERGPVVA